MMRRNRIVLAVCLVAAALSLVFIVVTGNRDRAQRDAEFLDQCRDAGYEAAKCRFFLTATGRMNGAAAAQMMLEGATPK
jgi:hypothetical protein